MESNTVLLVKKLRSTAYIPTRATTGSAGYDIFSPIQTVVPAYSQRTVNTDLAFCPPAGTYIRVAPRSSLAANCFVGIGGGVGDGDYRGVKY